MTHEHGREHQLRLVQEDETESLGRWMTCPDEVVQAMTGRQWTFR